MHGWFFERPGLGLARQGPALSEAHFDVPRSLLPDGTAPAGEDHAALRPLVEGFLRPRVRRLEGLLASGG